MRSAIVSSLIAVQVVLSVQRVTLPESELRWLRANSFEKVYVPLPPPAPGPQVFVVGDSEWPFTYPMTRWYRFQYYGPLYRPGIPLGFPLSFSPLASPYAIHNSPAKASTVHFGPRR